MLVAAVTVACGAHHSTPHARSSRAGSFMPSVTNAGNPGLIRATAAWSAGAGAPDYRQGDCFLEAARELVPGLKTDAIASTPAGSTTYSRAITSLRRLTAQPDTGATSAEQAQSQRAVVLLDRFFGTPGLYL